MMSHLGRPLLYGLGLTALWIVLAILNDGITYHLAPLLVGLVVPIGVALDPESEPGHILIGGATGAGVGLLATALLALFDRVNGPAIAPFTDPVLETVLLAIAGSVVGVVLGFINLSRR